jgi:hypothetical protein
MKLLLKQAGKACTEFVSFRISTNGRLCKHSTELSGSIKYGEFLDQLRTYQILRKNCASWSYCIV